jgi:hypothetical protein
LWETNDREARVIRPMAIRRHWCGDAAYCGGDTLVSALVDGWRVVDGRVERHDATHGTDHHTPIFTFLLERAGTRRPMRVIGNPFVERLIAEQGWFLTRQ